MQRVRFLLDHAALRRIDKIVKAISTIHAFLFDVDHFLRPKVEGENPAGKRVEGKA